MPLITPPISTMPRSVSSRLAAEARAVGARESALLREERLLGTQRPGVQAAMPSAVPKAGRPVNLADELPLEWLMPRAFRLFLLQNLAWDYTDTILDICAQQKIKDTKPLVRTVRELRRSYEIFRRRCVDSDQCERETDYALRFEEEVAQDLGKFHNALGIDTRRIDLSARAETLVTAVQDAMLILDAIVVYARSLDAEISAMGIWTCDCCLVQGEIMRLRGLIPQFAGDCYEATSGARALSARIIANRLRDITVIIKP